MKSHRISRTFVSVVVFTLGLIPKTSWAQIVPDTSLPTNSIVTPNANVFTLDGGTQTGGNLFHSFQEFSLPTGTEAFFNNGIDVQNIFTRVTGGKLSNIDGLLRANGAANLFLLNPSGIVFGPNARLDIGGSFFGSTADRIQFADGVEFSAQTSETTPLLSVNVPMGLHFGQNPGAITVRGSGHRTINPIFSPSDRSQNPVGLQVTAGHTLALIGGNVNLWGGIVSVAGGGHLEVGSVSDAQVKLHPTDLGWMGDYSGVEQFTDIHMAQQSLLDASGSGGSIQLQGGNIRLSEGSVALVQNLGTQPSAGITVNAPQSLSLQGNTADGTYGSLISIENLGLGQTGALSVSTGDLSLQNGGIIWTRTFDRADSSPMTVNATGTISIDGLAMGNPIVTSSIATVTWGSGNAGSLTVLSENWTLRNGAGVSSTTFSSGDSGTVRIQVKDQLEITGQNPILLSASAIGSSTFSSGNTRDLFIDTARLVIREGAALGSSSLASGSAGNVTINASESVEVTGRTGGSIVPSRISSTALVLDRITQEAFRLPAIPTGNSGSLSINTPSLRINDGALVTVRNEGPGKAGDIQINTNSMILDARGEIAASTASGNGGDIRLHVRDSLQMRHNSRISATAAGTGNGGNIELKAPVLVGLDNSDIIANAFQGMGGNIQIDTQGIFGLENRAQLTSQSDITASSQFGVNGVVAITNPSVDPTSSLVNLSQEVIDPQEQVVAGCQWTAQSQFMATGRGGVPTHPNRPLSSRRTWSDVRDLREFRAEATEAASAAPQTPPRPVEATGWVLREDGRVELVATDNRPGSGNFAPSSCDRP